MSSRMLTSPRKRRDVIIPFYVPKRAALGVLTTMMSLWRDTYIAGDSDRTADLRSPINRN